MSDFDFDELDRAVNGALGTSTPSPSQAEPTSQEAQEPATSSPSPAPATRRSSGRFMDMVHPASDMRTSRPEATPPLEAKQQEATPASSMGMSFEESTPMQEQPVNGAVAQPLESPFLPDAKVEKRPLGGVGVFPPSPPEPTPIAAPLEVETSADPHLMPDPIDFAEQTQSQPEESTPPNESLLEEKAQAPADLIEAPVKDEETSGSSDVTPEAQLEARLADIESETPEAIDLPTEVESTHSQSEAPVEPETPIGPTSISPQYKEQPSSTEPSGAIFDTEAYHQPLMHHAAKKKSGAWVILWILILVILGAGAGVAFYLYILPTL